MGTNSKNNAVENGTSQGTTQSGSVTEQTDTANGSSQEAPEVVVSEQKESMRKIHANADSSVDVGDVGRVTIVANKDYTLRDDVASLFVTLGVAQYT